MSSVRHNLQLLKWQVEALNPCDYLLYCSQLVHKFNEETKKWQIIEKRKRELELTNNTLTMENSSLNTRLSHVRNLFEEELDKNSFLEKKTKLLENQINLIREVLFDKNKTLLNDEQKAKLSFLDIPSMIQPNPSVNTPKKNVKRSASLLPPFKCEETDDSIDPIAIEKFLNEYDQELQDEKYNEQKNTPSSFSKKRPSDDEAIVISSKKPKNNSLYPEIQTPHNYGLSGRRSFLNHSHSEPSLNTPEKDEENLKSHRLSICDDIDVHVNDVAESKVIIKTPIRERSNTISNPTLSTWNSAGKLIKSRPHIFMYKSLFANESCAPCGKRIKFGSRVLKCRDCKTTCHPQCQSDVPLPCIPPNTPKLSKQSYHLTEFIPGNSPYIPAIVIHCIYAIECRGMKDVGLYRVPGSEKDVRELKEKFLKGKGAPCLDKIMDINVICGCLKDFFRNLSEPLITRSLWQEFVSAASIKHKDPPKGTTILCQAINKLPVANRDTLSFLMIHLQKVAAKRENKMPISNLAMIFAPSIVGYSSNDPTPFAEFYDFGKQALVIEQMLTLPTAFWNQFIDTDALLTIEQRSPPQHTGSTNAKEQNTPTKQKVGHSIKHPTKFFTSPRLFP